MHRGICHMHGDVHVNCVWEDVPDTILANGLRHVRCKRTGCNATGGPTADPYHKIYAPPCRGLPLASESNLWAGIFATWFKLDKPAAIVRYIRWRAKGSPLDELPPGVPAPSIAKPLLTDAEITELFPDEDPTLLGNRIKAMTEALGIPACGGCEARRRWLNSAHEWVRKARDATVQDSGS